MSITEQHTEESLCFAHIYALAGIAGVNYSAQRYDYGVDGQFSAIVRRRSRLVDSGFPLDFQAKATVDWELVDGNIVYDLESKTYNDFVGRSADATTMILILLCLPRDRNGWHEANCDETILRHCCYWHTITGEPTSNTSTKRIYIPARQLLTPAALNELLILERERRRGQTA